MANVGGEGILENLGLGELALAGVAAGVLGEGISPGYFKIPGLVGGQRRELIIQWYTAVAPTAGYFSFNFPIPFPNAFFADAAMPGGAVGATVNGGSVSRVARMLNFSAPMSVAIITVGW
ncbi:gp53-like domain-containing protein [Leminorella grimontii]|uniref:gp53-like domain-containing protein n=1 Tax=Leminorella grimontii TaxID=82981 RepID=UPI00322076F7